MKIGRYRGQPQVGAADVQSESRKKALLIGINYENSQVPADGPGRPLELHGPHRDVNEMRTLLIELYGYQEEHIVLMLDKEGYGELQPTRVNMLREISNLVKDAQPGDHFFFHYSGHSTQIKNKNNSEEDGMDECLVPSDGETRIITDNELRRHLVDSLPIGSSLVAVFDSCHSASLLDLEHFRCNRVYVPWVSKGRRRSDSLWNANVRRQAIVVSRHIYQSRRVSSKKVKSRKTSIDQILHAPTRGMSIHKSKSLSMNSNLERWYDTPSSPIERCSSPVSLWPCTGSCPPSEAEEAHVMSLAACKDDQVSWEDDDGASMTTALIDILKNNPHPTLRELMTLISHQLHNFSLHVHRLNRKYKKDLKNWHYATGTLPPKSASDGYLLDTDNFQDPQLASHRPLDMSARWVL